MAAAVLDETVGRRGLHLVDLENLLADPWARGPSVGNALDEYLERAGFHCGDLVFVAGNPWLMVELGWSHGVDCHRFAARGPEASAAAARDNQYRGTRARGTSRHLGFSPRASNRSEFAELVFEQSANFS